MSDTHTKKTIFRGAATAIVTPFKKSKLDEDTYYKLIKRQINNGIDAVVPVGTTGESATLTHSEHKSCIEIAVAACKGTKVKVLAGAGSNATHEAVDLAKFARDNNADGILSVTPYYNKPSQEGLYRHYEAIAKASKLPIILYNVPGRTGVNMLPETTLRLAHDFSNIVAIKEASGNFTQIDDIIKNKPERFSVISGDDGITYPLLTLGAVGVISVIGNAFPYEFSRMVRLALNGDYQHALLIHHQFTELIKLLFVEGNPAGVKSMLAAMGFIENRLRLPLVPTTITTYEKIRRVLDQLDIKA